MGPLIRRSPAEPDELAFHPTHAREETTPAELVRVAGARWAVENCFEAAKGGAGLDEYEVRSWVGRHRHVTLAMLARAHLAASRKAALGGGADEHDLAIELLPVTVPEVRRPLWRLAWNRTPSSTAVLCWSDRRRRHRQRARRCRWHKRAGQHEPRL